MMAGGTVMCVMCVAVGLLPDHESGLVPEPGQGSPEPLPSELQTL